MQHASVPYRVLIIDDQLERAQDWAPRQAKEMKEAGYEVDVSPNWNDAQAKFRPFWRYDVFVVDIDLAVGIQGPVILEQLKGEHLGQPMILVTREDMDVNMTPVELANLFALGNVHFHVKSHPTIRFETVFDNALRQINPVRHSIKKMVEAGLGDFKIEIDGQTFELNRLLETRELYDKAVALMSAAMATTALLESQYLKAREGGAV